MEARIMVVVSVMVTLLYGSFVFFTYVSVRSDVKQDDHDLPQLTNQSESKTISTSTIIQPTPVTKVIEIIVDGKDGSSSITNNNSSSSYLDQLCLNYCGSNKSLKADNLNEVVDCVCPN